MWLMDVFRDDECLVAWIKTKDDNRFVQLDHEVSIYAQPCTAITNALQRRGIAYEEVEKRTYDHTKKRVLKIPAPIKNFERFVAGLEKETQHRVPLYHADISPEDDWLYTSGLHIGSGVDEDLNKQTADLPVLTTLDLELTSKQEITKLVADGKEFTGSELAKLLAFITYFQDKDPDVIRAYRAFRVLPVLDARLRHHGLDSPLHRYKDRPLHYRGGNTFHSYGQVRFRDFGVRLHGRLLVDTSTAMGMAALIQWDSVFFSSSSRIFSL